MKLATFDAGRGPQLGAIVDARIVPLSAAAPGLPGDMIGLIAAWPQVEGEVRRVAEAAAGALALDTVRLLAPIRRPGKIMAIGLNLTLGYAGQISLAQWAFAGVGALIAGRMVRADVPVELAILLGVLLTIPVGLVFAVPALRTRGVNLAVVTLGLGFLVSEVVFANPNYLGASLDGGTRIGRVKLFGIEVDAFNHPHAWAAVSLIVFVLLAMLAEYAGVMGPLVGAGRRYDGPLGKSDRASVFGALGLWTGLWLPMPDWLAYLMPLLAILLAATVWNRVRRGIAQI